MPNVHDLSIGGVSLDEGDRTVRRTVVNDDNFSGTSRLIERALDGVGHEPFAVVARDDDRDFK